MADGPERLAPLVDAGLRSAPAPRAVLWSIVRSAGLVAGLLVVYALAPIREETALAVGAFALLGLIVVGVVFVRQLRRISRAHNPLGAAVEALGLVFGMFLALFAFAYVSLAVDDPAAFTQPVDKVAGVYFSVTVLATVGFGDIAPVSDTARIVVTAQMVLDLVLIGSAVKLLGASARQAVERRSETVTVAGPGAAQASNPGPAPQDQP